MSASHDEWKQRQASKAAQSDEAPVNPAPFDMVGYANDLLHVFAAMQRGPAPRQVVCGYCNGSGSEPLYRESSAGQQGGRCPQCGGVGRVWR